MAEIPPQDQIPQQPGPYLPAPPPPGGQAQYRQYPPLPPGGRRIPWLAFVLGGCGCLVLFVTIMAAILFPVFAHARSAARAKVCMTNEKSLGLAALMYLQDYNEIMPPSSGWMDRVQPYTHGSIAPEKNPTFHCPSIWKQDPEIFGYAYNKGLDRKRLNTVSVMTETAILYDSSNLIRNASDAGTSLPVPGRHTQRNNICYVDGHVQAVDGGSVGGPTNTQ